MLLNRVCSIKNDHDDTYKAMKKTFKKLKETGKLLLLMQALKALIRSKLSWDIY